MMTFVLDNPSPGVIAIISGDADFAYAAATLRLRGHRILLISPMGSSNPTLKSQADWLFNWQKDVLQPAQQADSEKLSSSKLPDPTPSDVAAPMYSATDVCSPRSVGDELFLTYGC